MRSSLQQTAGPSKAAKFVNANPLDPMLRPFSNDGSEDVMQTALADKINRQFESDTTARNVAPDRNHNPVYHQAAEHHPVPVQQPIPAQPYHPPSMDFNNQPNRGGTKDGSDDDSDDDEWLDDEDLASDPVLQAIRHRRLQELQQQHSQRLELAAKGHGEVRTISQDEFLQECTNGYVVVHFFHREFQRCQILDHHLQKMAPLHLECKFLRLNAEKAPFFVTKLKVRTLPSLLVFEDGKIVDRMTGFDKVLSASDADPDAWETSRLQLWLATTGAIQYTAPKKSHDEGYRVGYRARIYRGDGMDDNDDM